MVFRIFKRRGNFQKKTQKGELYFNRLEKKGKVDIFLAFCPASIKEKIMNKIKSVTLKTKNRHFFFFIVQSIYLFSPSIRRFGLG